MSDFCCGTGLPERPNRLVEPDVYWHTNLSWVFTPDEWTELVERIQRDALEVAARECGPGHGSAEARIRLHQPLANEKLHPRWRPKGNAP